MLKDPKSLLRNKHGVSEKLGIDFGGLRDVLGPSNESQTESCPLKILLHSSNTTRVGGMAAATKSQILDKKTTQFAIQATRAKK